MLFDDVDRRVSLALLRKQNRNSGLRILTYCVMTNLVHLAAIPSSAESMSKPLHTLGARTRRTSLPSRGRAGSYGSAVIENWP